MGIMEKKMQTITVGDMGSKNFQVLYCSRTGTSRRRCGNYQHPVRPKPFSK